MSDEKKPIFRRPTEPTHTPLNGYVEMSLEYHRRVEEKRLKSQNKQWGYYIISDDFEEEDNSAPDWWE
jgi:hypothetical protein